MPLTTRQRHRARALAHHLAPTVTIGRSGLSDALVAKTVEELSHHELIKVKIFTEDRAGLLGLADQLAAVAEADLVQVIGKVAVLYRRRRKEPVVNLG